MRLVRGPQSTTGPGSGTRRQGRAPCGQPEVSRLFRDWPAAPARRSFVPAGVGIPDGRADTTFWRRESTDHGGNAVPILRQFTFRSTVCASFQVCSPHSRRSPCKCDNCVRDTECVVLPLFVAEKGWRRHAYPKSSASTWRRAFQTYIDAAARDAVSEHKKALLLNALGVEGLLCYLRVVEEDHSLETTGKLQSMRTVLLFSS
ncbi:hypothetical protein HPB50_009815 [Hyalomma asiaticum]|uniref:Uncharacterized protein n=1 Tax=Hyalomma asiaticum TaxID=266040 RepID=A0ACB7T5I9_HYAAI|nr:hypothetical protein HPB50_009815 [Hyalomma asiaticum]